MAIGKNNDKILFDLNAPPVHAHGVGRQSGVIFNFETGVFGFTGARFLLRHARSTRNRDVVLR